MKPVWMFLLLSLAWPAAAQPPAGGDDAAKKGEASKKAEAAKPAEKKKDRPRPRVGIKRNGNVGDDAPGGGATSAPSSKGGTPGTPSGSFTKP